MALTVTQFAERAARIARKGRTEQESRIFLDRVALLIPNAQHQFSWEVAQDRDRRGRMRHSWVDVALTNGQLELIPPTMGNLLVAALPWAQFFDGDDDELRYPLIFKREPQSLFGPLNVNFGYVAVLDNFLLTKKRTSGSLTEMSTITMFANYVFDFGGTYNLPEEFEDDALLTLANLAVTDVEAAS